jgi:hypothetical protein
MTQGNEMEAGTVGKRLGQTAISKSCTQIRFVLRERFSKMNSNERKSRLLFDSSRFSHTTTGGEIPIGNPFGSAINMQLQRNI